MKTPSVIVRSLFLLCTLAAAMTSPASALFDEPTQPKCDFQEDAQSAVTECLQWDHACGTPAVACCLKEDQAINWTRCTKGDEKKTRATDLKVYKKAKWSLCENGVCKYQGIVQSDNFVMVCKTLKCD